MTDLQTQLTAALADRYVIERKLGEGGMAVVYLANDVKHDRPVAVKVLHPDLAASIGAERFLREIQITARLSHPHILPLYDSGAADGFLYYVMPYVVGESLSDLMEREKQLSLEEAIRITREVAEALAYAHSMGLVHRDIKPDNIMMSGGHAIVADFGIARAVSEAGGDKLTQTGMAVGTPAYMSPEQAAGDEVDGRSDIYSLGCVLYELVVGQVPFTGPTPMAVMARHSMDQVPPPHIMRQTVPEDLEDVIYVAMAKAPADRFRTAQEMVDALNAIGSDTGSQRRLSISAQRPARQRHARPGRIRKIALPAGGVVLLAALAFAGWRLIGHGSGGAGSAESVAEMSHVAVLYFQDRSPDKSLDYLASGLTEGLIQQLSNVGALHVISANGVRPYRNADVSSDSLRKALRVGTLVEGSVAQDGDRLRVSVALVNARTGDQVVDTTITARRHDVFALQDTLAQDVSRFLRKRLGTEVTLREQRSGTRNPAAWEALQHAKQAERDADTLAAAGDTAGRRRQDDLADSLLAVAETLDEKWVVPTTERGWLAFERARAVVRSRTDAGNRWSQEALTHAMAAFQKAPGNADALDLLGTVRYWRTMFGFVPDAATAVALRDSAENDLATAVQIDSNQAHALSLLAFIYLAKGEVAQGKLYAQRAYEADPYLQNVDQTLWRLYSASFELEDASQASYWCAEYDHRFPKDPRGAWCRIGVQMLSTNPHRIDSAWAALRDFVALSAPGDSAKNLHQGELWVALTIARASVDRPEFKDSARDVAARAVANTESIDPTKDFHLTQAAVLAWIGDKDEAVRQVSIYLAANPQNRGGSPSDLPWEYKPLLNFPKFRSLMGYPPLK